MRTSMVHPQNYAANATEGDNENRNIPRNQEANLPPTKRCILLSILIIVVAVIVICAIVIPLAINAARKKCTCQPITTSPTAENTTSLETTATSVSTTEQNITTISSSTSNDHIGINTTKGIMGSRDSSTWDIRLMTSITAPTKDGNKGDTERISVDTSTGTNSISNEWMNNSISTTVFITDVTNTKPTSVTVESASTIEITTSRPMIALNHVNDTIIGLYNTTAGGSTGGSNGTYFGNNTMPQYAMDGLLTTKYFNYGLKRNPNLVGNRPGIGTGFLVIPSISNATTACALHFATANGGSERHPITVTLEGSYATNINALHNGSSWTLIYDGSTGINATYPPGKQTYGTLQNIPNPRPFASYRLLITSQRNDSNAVEYSEARIMGYV